MTAGGWLAMVIVYVWGFLEELGTEAVAGIVNE
jgi:hypothetical protein